MIGVDFGGTRIKAAIVEGGELSRFEAIETEAGSSPAHVLDTVASLVKSLKDAPTSVGLAIPGEVDQSGRCWRLPNVPGFEGVAIADELSHRLGGTRVVVENDATTAALGELLYGHGRSHQSFVLMTLGTGIGGGVVIDGKLRRGAHGFAGELGHIMIDPSPDAWPCNCGLKGCVEAYAGTRALLRRYAELGHEADSIRAIADAAHAGESAAREVFHAMGRALGTALVGIQNVLDLDAVVFTGGISASFDLIETGVRVGLQARPFARVLAEVPLLVSTVGEHAGVIGAAHLAEYRGE